MMIKKGYVNKRVNESRRRLAKSRRRLSEANKMGHFEPMSDYFRNYFPQYDPGVIGEVVFTGDDMFGDLERQGLNGYGVWVGYQHDMRGAPNRRYFAHVTDVVYNEVVPAFEEFVVEGLGGDPDKIVVENLENRYDMYRLYYITDQTAEVSCEELLRDFVATNCSEYLGLVDSYIREVPNLEAFEDVNDMYRDFCDYAETILPSNLIEMRSRRRPSCKSLREASVVASDEYCIQVRRPGKQDWVTVNSKGVPGGGGEPKTFDDKKDAKASNLYKKFDSNPDWEVRVTNDTDLKERQRRNKSTRIMNEIWDGPSYSPRGLSYASQPSERELALEKEFDAKFTIEFNGELVEVMPLGNGRLLIKQTGSGIQDWDAQSMLNRIHRKAEGALYNNENFFLDVRRPDHYSASLVQWFLRVLDDPDAGAVLANDIDGTRKFETVDEALETCAPMWESELTELFKKDLAESKRASRKNKLKESQLPDNLVEMAKEDGSFIGQNVEGIVEDGCMDPIDMILEKEIDEYFYDSYVSNDYPEYEEEFKLAAYAAAYDYLAGRGLV